LRALGFDATPYLSLGAKGFRGIRQDPPHAILIDLTRLPSYGKAMGVLLRQQKSLGAIPLVFVEGDPDKAAQVRAVLPDAVYTTWAKAEAAIRRAIRQAPPESMPPRDPGTPLLGQTRHRRGVPRGAAAPAGGVRTARRPHPKAGGRSRCGDGLLPESAALGRELPDLAGMMRKGRRVWVLWPKKASGWTAI
jgi:hypothetical protein